MKNLKINFYNILGQLVLSNEIQNNKNETIKMNIKELKGKFILQVVDTKTNTILSNEKIICN